MGLLGDEKGAASAEKPIATTESLPAYRDVTSDSETDEPNITKDGIKLHPQPTADPLDPLNWSFVKKHVILGIVMLNFAQANWTVALPALGLALGPLFWSSFGDIYGRRIIFILGTTIALVSTIGVAVADTYGGYMAGRFFQGFGVSPAATVGMAVVGDLFFDYERGRKLGLWVLAIDCGLLLGPTIGGFMDLVSAAWVNWLNAILFATLLVLEIFFMPETLYPRNLMLTRAPLAASRGQDLTDVEKVTSERSSAAPSIDIPRTSSLAFFNLKPVPGMRHPKPWDTLVRFFLTFRLLDVVIVAFAYCYLFYWWILSILTMLPAAYADKSPQVQGLLVLGLLIGTVVAETGCSGWLSDRIVLKLAKKNGNVREPEMRLWLMYPAFMVGSVGLIIWGVSIDKAYHWMVGQVAFFLFAGSIQVGNMVTASYLVDAYPKQSMSVITFYAVFLNMSAFVDPFFIAPWQATAGWTWTFAGHAIITLLGGIPLVAALHYFGPKLRGVSPKPSWVNPEFDPNI